MSGSSWAATDRRRGAEGNDQGAGFDHEFALRDLREESLSEYTKAAWPLLEPFTPYLNNWHIDAIAEHLEAVTFGQIRRLMICMPPRYMKSICVSVMWPTWEWGPRNMPQTRWMFGAYSADLSIMHSDDRLTVMTSPWYRERWGDRFKLVKSLKSEYTNDHSGRVIATSVTGQATGKVNRVVIDDFLTPEQALSDTLRSTANQIFDRKFSQRLNDKGKDAIVIVMQRLHQNDLAGHVLELMKEEGWATLILPGEAEKRQQIVFPRSGTVVERQKGGPTTITRPADPLIEDFARLAPMAQDAQPVEVIEDGGLLWPAREGPKEIEERKWYLGSDGFAGQYQQRPAPLGGRMIKRSWFRRYNSAAMPAINRLILSLDTAFNEGPQNGYSVCEVWARCGGGFYLLEVWRQRVQFPDLKRAALSLNKRWAPSALLIEDSASSQSLIQELCLPAVGPGGTDQPVFIAGQSPAGQFADQAIPVVPINAGEDKFARAAAVSSLIDAGLVWLPEDAPWVEEFLHQVCNFPAREHDDQLAAMAYALTYLRGSEGREAFYRQEAPLPPADEAALRRGEEPAPRDNPPRENHQRRREQLGIDLAAPSRPNRLIPHGQQELRKTPVRRAESLPVNRRGRPRKFHPEPKLVGFLVEAGLKLNEIPAWLEISRATFFRRRRESKEFCDAVRRGQATGFVVSNAQYELIKAGDLRAIIRFLRKRGRCVDPNHCPDEGWLYLADKWQAERQIIRALTPEERRLYHWLRKLAYQHQKAAVRVDRQDGDSGSPFGETPKPANRRTGRSTWSSPDLAIVAALAERARTRAHLAACLGIDRSTLYKKMQDCAEFRDAVKMGEAALEALAIARLVEHAKNGSLTALKFWMRVTPDHHHSALCMPPEERAKDLEWLQTRSFWTSAERWVFCQLLRRAEARLKQPRAGRGTGQRARGSKTKAASQNGPNLPENRPKIP